MKGVNVRCLKTQSGSEGAEERIRGGCPARDQMRPGRDSFKGTPPRFHLVASTGIALEKSWSRRSPIH
ncbi:hypothetical protein PRIPAC_81599 [Pristionchus pacificus]|uniref:Uncharacterized protein n=1 Tax=Pristionchus pacificus TaxID=54126 RepID=A0A2A6CMM1_PRIPA|nr:hypothetical protein PRIPAC_81599 [Pristionchus pacificus]|eukprot:PDM79303.1 hypothetical protein PRIPAC_31882 [Pristionchus pacificus]